MSETGTEAETLIPDTAEKVEPEPGKTRRFVKWLKNLRNSKAPPHAETNAESSQSTLETSLPISGGEAKTQPQPEKAKKGYQPSDTAKRMDRAESIGTNKLNPGMRAALTDVIGGPGVVDKAYEKAESLEDLVQRAKKEQERIASEKKANRTSTVKPQAVPSRAA